MGGLYESNPLNSVFRLMKKPNFGEKIESNLYPRTLDFFHDWFFLLDLQNINSNSNDKMLHDVNEPSLENHMQTVSKQKPLKKL